jgi:hypothetical protein
VKKNVNHDDLIGESKKLHARRKLLHLSLRLQRRAVIRGANEIFQQPSAQ